ncbi:Pkinase-domain-containing protein [Armillaria solidipes]|uniref:Serine/threonine-protein kinase n=1 Tax=Armillaria solidipes TaxID=1076256 RepID=A0A2H3BGS5_9AGAR|nr:Pkinase-domain-containing protein [Armillaria solidipes]
MSTHVYPMQAYNRMPAPPLAGPSKRYPLNVVNNYVTRPPASPPKPAEKQKQPASPPLPRQNSKTAPPSPPKVISDSKNNRVYHRMDFLGEGGFARVYEVKDVRGSKWACKVVTKSSLKTKKAKTKLFAEIKIHRSLEHPNIVGFVDCFEDDENVYMTLELCLGGSLMDLLRRRRRFTEPETRFFMVQILGACHYMHTHQVIHRDLKLGNIFLDANMNIKVGDFGLAALIENEGERKKTICGTPNYIAPEVLFDTANGHSFEVDTWSTGVILYTLVVGRPPFQTKEVKGIYNRIKQNDYDFPPERPVSSEAKELITSILASDPQLRPTVHEIVAHPFLSEGTFPPYIPISANESVPTFQHINHVSSEANYRRVKRKALLDEDQVISIALPKSQVSTTTSGAMKSVTSSIAQQEKEFQKAVQPGSPISALLSSARQPLLMSTTSGNGVGNKESPLMRKLQAASKQASPLGPPKGRGAVGRVAGRGLQGIREEDGEQQQREKARRKEVDSMKARIVAQMAEPKEDDTEEERENMPPVKNEVRKRKDVDVRDDRLQRDGEARLTGQELENRLTGFDGAAHVLSLAFDAKERGKLFRDPREDPQLPLPEERVFIVSWVDYCNKYGMGYALTDGSVGVHFNDTTSLILSADKRHFDYLAARKQGVMFVKKSYTVDEYPEDLKNKVYLLKHFERYIMDRLYGEYEYTFEDVDRTKGMDWVQKYLRMKHVIVFKMSHDVLQFNFYDHSKIILSSHGLLVTHIDKHYKMTRWSLSEIMTTALKAEAGNIDEAQAKFNGKLVDKLRYCREVLVNIKTASGVDEGVKETKVTKRTSKTSLR